MSSADKLRRFFKKAELNINSEADEKIFQDVFQAHRNTIKSKSAQPVNIGRIIMKSHLTKIAAAIIVMSSILVGITLLNTTSNTAIAQVLAQLEEINAYKYHLKIHHIDQIANNNYDSTTQSEVLVSKEYGIKSKMDIVNTNDENDVKKSESYYFAKDMSQILINHFSKTYTKVKIDKALLSTQSDGYTDPYELVKRFLKNGFKDLGRSNMNGIEVGVFQTNEQVKVMGLNAESVTKLYVDLKTSLPVKIESNTHLEGKIENSKSNTNSDTEVVYSDFQWNVPVDASDFVPVIPDDYTLTVSNSLDEETALKGLKLYAEIFGKYPEDLGPDKLSKLSVEIMKSESPAAKKIQEQIQEQMQNQPRNSAKLVKIVAENTASISNAGMFYLILNVQKKDAAYYGDIVSPGDANNVLMRWKVSDNDYRVVFGDLKVETVTSETLKVLEKTLPK